MPDCWKESRLVLENVDFSAVSHVAQPDIAESVVIAAVVFLFVVFFKRECLAVSVVFGALFNRKKIKEIENNQNYYSAVVVTALVCIPFFAAIAVKPGGGMREYGIICAALVLLVVVRKLLFAFLAWLKENKDVFREIRRSLGVYMIIITVMCLPLLVVRAAFPDLFGKIMEPYILSVAGSVYFIYLARSLKTIISSGFSHFFGFLYLCALELLPIGLIISVYLSL